MPTANQVNLSNVYTTEQSKVVQAICNKKSVVETIGRVDATFPSLRKGQAFDNPYTNEPTTGTHVPYTDIEYSTIELENDKLLIGDTRYAAYKYDKTLNNLSKTEYQAEMNFQLGHQLGMIRDQDGIQKMIDLAASSSDAGTVTSSAFPDLIGSIRAGIQRKRGFSKGRRRFLLLPPEMVIKASKYLLGTGNNVADSMLGSGFDVNNGFLKTVVGWDLYESNNVPTSQVMTLDTQPTAGKTMEVAGSVWTFVANGAASGAGEISIGASLAATQAIVLDAINGTGTPGASTYIDVALTERSELKNARIVAGAFNGSDESTITGFEKIDGSFPSADGGNTFAAEKSYIVGGVYGSLDIKQLMTPMIETEKQPNQPVINTAAYLQKGEHVYFQNRKGLYAMAFDL